LFRIEPPAAVALLTLPAVAGSPALASLSTQKTLACATPDVASTIVNASPTTEVSRANRLLNAVPLIARSNATFLRER
jgi:hypothetical protein